VPEAGPAGFAEGGGSRRVSFSRIASFALGVLDQEHRRRAQEASGAAPAGAQRLRAGVERTTRFCDGHEG
jgi:hypothetical protein